MAARRCNWTPTLNFRPLTVSAPTHRNHRYPIEVVARAVWLYFRFNLSLRDVAEMLFDRGIVVSYETIRRWCRRKTMSGISMKSWYASTSEMLVVESG